MRDFFAKHREIVYLSSAFVSLAVVGGLLVNRGTFQRAGRYKATPVIATVTEKQGNELLATKVGTTDHDEKIAEQTSEINLISEAETTPFWKQRIEIIPDEEPIVTTESTPGTLDNPPQTKTLPTIDPWFVPPTKLVELQPSVPVDAKTPEHIENDHLAMTPATPFPSPIAPEKDEKKTLVGMDQIIDTFGVPLSEIKIIETAPVKSKSTVAQKTPDWVPFVCLYERSHSPWCSDRMLYIFPTWKNSQDNAIESDETGSKNDGKKLEETILTHHSSGQSLCCPYSMPSSGLMYSAPYPMMFPVAYPVQIQYPRAVMMQPMYPAVKPVHVLVPQPVRVIVF